MKTQTLSNVYKAGLKAPDPSSWPKRERMESSKLSGNKKYGREDRGIADAANLTKTLNSFFKKSVMSSKGSQVSGVVEIKRDFKRHMLLDSNSKAHLHSKHSKYSSLNYSQSVARWGRTARGGDRVGWRQTCLGDCRLLSNFTN